MKMCKVHGMQAALGAALLLAGACSKSESGGAAATATAVPTEAPTISITGTPPPASAAPASASAPASAVASAVASASASAVASAKPSASASARPSASASAKPSDSAKTTALAPSASKPEATPLKGAATRITGKNFTLDVASPGCRVDTPCVVTLRLLPAGDFHVNKEYPYKFTAGAAPSVQFLGNGDANVFSRAAGDFREEGEKAATMTVRLKPAAAGEARVSGTYKMSVCSAEQCQIETQAVQLAVPVM